MNNNKDAQTLKEIHDILYRTIKGINATIFTHLSSDINIDIIFLKRLFAEAKELREADKIVVDKLKELIKEDNNVVQKK